MVLRGTVGRCSMALRWSRQCRSDCKQLQRDTHRAFQTHYGTTSVAHRLRHPRQHAHPRVKRLRPRMPATDADAVRKPRRERTHGARQN
jgi:hypothetical protein